MCPKLTMAGNTGTCSGSSHCGGAADSPVLPIIGLAIRLVRTSVAKAVLEVLRGFQPQGIAAAGSHASVIVDKPLLPSAVCFVEQL